jgi:hypothetical protein
LKTKFQTQAKQKLMWFRLVLSAPGLDLNDVLQVLKSHCWEANVQQSFGVENGEIHPGVIVTVHGDTLPSIAEVVTALRAGTNGFGCAFVQTSDGRSGCSETFV